MLNTGQLRDIYSNEQILLILLARLYFGTCSREQVTGFMASNNIMWHKVHGLAKIHGIRSFVFHVITYHNIEVKSEFKDNLQKRYNNVKIKNLSQINTVAKLVNQFEQHGIRLIPYKGASFSEAYYADWAARESADIDFLIHPAFLPRIEDNFIQQGYKAQTTVPRPYLPYYRRYFKDMVYQHPDTKVNIEMHWRLMEQFSGDYPGYDFFLNGLVPYNTGSFNFHKLTPTYDFLAVASNHFVKDMYIKFKYLIDMASLIHRQRGDLNIEFIFECAQKYAFEKKLDTGLGLISELLGVQLTARSYIAIPASILKTPLAESVYLNRLYINEPKFIRRSLLLQDNLGQQVRFLMRCFIYMFLPTYADINTHKLPVYMLPLLVLVRPFRLLYLIIKKR